MNLAKISRYAVAVLGVMLMGMTYSPSARAITGGYLKEELVVTFDAPVLIPGMVLRPGTYIFELASPNWTRNVVDIYKKTTNGPRFLDTVLTIPAFRLGVANKPVFTFQESASNGPVAIQTWFYPDMEYGHRFVYQGSQARQMAKVKSTQAPSVVASVGAE